MNATPIFSPRRWTASLLLIVLCVLTSSQKAAAGKQPKVFSIWKKLPTEQLVKIGHRFANNPEQPDSALLALTIVTNRYDKSMSREDKILVQRAQRMKAYVYLYSYYDYAKAYDCLLHAQDIADETNYVSPSTSLDFGLLFSSIGDQTNESSTRRKALEYMRIAFKQSLQVGDHNIANTAFGNAITIAWTLEDYDILKNEWKQFKRLKNNDAPEFTRFNLYYYQILMLLKGKRYDATLPLFDKQIALMPDDDSHARYTMITYYNKARVLALMERYKEAIDILTHCEQISKKYGTKDVSAEIYRNLADYQKRLGNE